MTNILKEINKIRDDRLVNKSKKIKLNQSICNILNENLDVIDNLPEDMAEDDRKYLLKKINAISYITEKAYNNKHDIVYADDDYELVYSIAEDIYSFKTKSKDKIKIEEQVRFLALKYLTNFLDKIYTVYKSDEDNEKYLKNTTLKNIMEIKSAADVFYNKYHNEILNLKERVKLKEDIDEIQKDFNYFNDAWKQKNNSLLMKVGLDLPRKKEKLGYIKITNMFHVKHMNEKSEFESSIKEIKNNKSVDNDEFKINKPTSENINILKDMKEKLKTIGLKK